MTGTFPVKQRVYESSFDYPVPRDSGLRCPDCNDRPLKVTARTLQTETHNFATGIISTDSVQVISVELPCGHQFRRLNWTAEWDEVANDWRLVYEFERFDGS